MEQSNTSQQTEQTEKAEQIKTVNAKNGKFKAAVKEYFSAKRIAYMAVFTALAYLLYMPIFEFPIFPAVPFLKVDFSNTFVMVAGFSLGPAAGMVVGILKEILHALTFSQTVGVGEVANVIMLMPYVLIPAVVYKKHKGIKTVIICLICGSMAQTLISYFVNKYLNFPFFLQFNWQAAFEFFDSVWYFVVLFNLIKTTLVSIAVMLVYKPLSRIIKRINSKFKGGKRAAGQSDNNAAE